MQRAPFCATAAPCRNSQKPGVLDTQAMVSVTVPLGTAVAVAAEAAGNAAVVGAGGAAGTTWLLLGQEPEELEAVRSLAADAGWPPASHQA